MVSDPARRAGRRARIHRAIIRVSRDSGPGFGCAALVLHDLGHLEAGDVDVIRP